MHSKLLSLAAFASLGAAQTVNLTTAISSNPSLTNLTQYLGLFPQIVSTLAGLTNITLLAPNNDAFTKLLSGPAATQVNAQNTALVNALFTYHVLDGTYRSTDITSKPAFIPTALVDPAYTNLTSGQRVEAVASGQKVVFYSGLLGKSTVTQAVWYMLPLESNALLTDCRISTSPVVSSTSLTTFSPFHKTSPPPSMRSTTPQL
jgi:uncharacterized surface protein with fasciclin (FAS1) repeats